MDTVQETCDRAIWLDGGGVRAEGDPEQVVAQYLRGFADEALGVQQRGQRVTRGQRWGSGEIELTDVRFLDENGVEKHYFATGEPMCVEMHYTAHKRIKNPVFGMAFHSSDGAWINGSNTSSSGCDIDWVEGQGRVTYFVERLPLMEGSYLFTAAAYDYSQPIHQAYDHLDRAFLVQVRHNKEVGEPLGMVHIPCQWKHKGTA
jgi:hypothetical protein